MVHKSLGIAIVGLGGAVGTTMVAGIELLKNGLAGTDGLPLAQFNDAGLVDYSDIVFAGWDLFPDHLAKAAEQHDVLTNKQFSAVEEGLRAIKPWPAVSDP
jgi:myo-inositol-1-phosphate synthase